jgi:hypothetical protein
MATVFISCGQYTADEKALGKQVCELVRTLSHEPYFAENQNSLKGLHENILAKLYECTGFITIMHPRGEVQYSAKAKHIRGSVWIEQEIAIAAFITHCMGRKIEVAAFIHEDIRREGIRDLLHLNPIQFRTNEEVLNRLPGILSTWKLEAANVKLHVRYNRTRTSSERHDYQLEVLVENTGSARIEQYQLDFMFPNAFLEQSTYYTQEVRERRTATHRRFRITERDLPNEVFFPGDIKRLFILDYFMDRDLSWNSAAMQQQFTVTFRYGDGQSVSAEYAIREFQIF